MLLKRRIRFKLLFFLMLLCVACGFYFAYRLYNPSKEASSQWIVPNINDPAKKIIARESLINSIKQKQELIPLEMDLAEKVTIDNSWGNMELFKKVQNIYFAGTGIYSVDLSKLHAEVATNNVRPGDMTIVLPKPIVKAISIDEQKTIYETPQTGLLRFGEIKLSPLEMQSVISEAKLKMNEKMQSSEIYEQALNSSELALRNLIKSILSNESDLNFRIKFEE
jgi:hypothetical protein